VHPSTRASAVEIAAAEGGLPLERLVAAGADGATVESFQFPRAAAVV
jgi:hypothetical protein